MRGPVPHVLTSCFERAGLSMDLSWNYAAESQAYDRVHRLGQEKDVFVKRLVVENTIEERMLRLQDVKMGAHSFIPVFDTSILKQKN